MTFGALRPELIAMTVQILSYLSKDFYSVLYLVDIKIFGGENIIICVSKL